MTRDRDISLGEIDSVPVEDGRRRRPAATAGNPAPKPGSGAPPPPSSPKPGPGRPRNGGGSGGGHGWMAAALVMGLILLLGGAWLWRELTHMRAQLDAQLEASQQKLGNLESQLSATDESLNQSSDKVRETLKLHDSEIRKLWDVSNKRNRDLIQENKVAVQRLDDKRVELAKLVAGLQTQLESLRKQQDRANLQRNQQQTQLDLMSESVKQIEQRLGQQREALARLNEMMPQLEKLAAAERQGGGVAKRLASIEAAVEAFDAWRRQVNNRLDRLEGRAPASSGTAP